MKDIIVTDELDYKILLSTESFVKKRKFWEDQLADELPSSDIFINSLDKTLECKCQNLNINGIKTDVLMSFCKGSELSLYIYLVTVIKIILSRYMCENDIVLYSPLYYKNKPNSFTNDTVILRNSIFLEDTIKETLLKVRESVLKAYENQEYPLSEIINSDQNTYKDYNSLNKIICSLNGIHGTLNKEKYKNDILINFQLNGNELEGSLFFNGNKYSKDLILGFIKHVTENINNLHKFLLNKIEDVNYEGINNYIENLNDFNKIKANPYNKTVIELFEEQVLKTPDNKAVIFKERKITYAELNNKANQLANLLRKKRIDPNIPVAIFMNREPELIISILGILKSGGCYLPIDMGIPEERIKLIIEDSQCKLVIAFLDSIKNIECEIIDIGNWELIDNESTTISSNILPNNLAYVIYTSGTTGNPKGVMIEHKSLFNYVSWANEKYAPGNSDSFALYTSISFDLTVTSIFVPLINGNTIICYPENKKSLSIENVITDNQIQILKVTPSHLRILKELHIFKSDNYKSSIKQLIVGGEALTTELAKEIFNLFNGKVEIYNEYGPTETTVGCMIYKYNFEKDKRNTVPIGIPIVNTQIYLLDKYLKPILDGVVGEIYISGDCLARGYLFNHELTEEKFINNPIVKGQKIYKTGDLARRLPDGNIEFIGREDNQVKIRGFRIELCEIEKVLMDHKQITNAVVLLKEEGDTKNLVSFYISDNALDNSELHNYLSIKLPDYMIPALLIQLDKFPLTDNGKIDKKELLKYDVSILDEYEPPKSDIEKLLVTAWTKVLNKEKVGITDNFFNLGGDSIRSIQISSKLHSLGYKTTLTDIFQYPTIKQLSPHIKKIEIPYDQNVVIGVAPLTPIQRRFFSFNSPKNNHYNLSFTFKFQHKIDAELVEVIFKHIQNHHDALRLVFYEKDNEIVQECRDDNMPLSLNVVNLTELNDPQHIIKEEISKVQESLDLSQGPLMKLILFKLNQEDRLFITIHHLVFDAVSLGILLEDIKTLFRQSIENEPLLLPGKTNSFLNWGNLLEQYISSDKYLEAKAYWLDVLNQSVPSIPVDYVNGRNLVKDIDTVEVSLQKEYTDKLLTDANKAFKNQINDLLITALFLALKKCYGLNSVKIDVEGHGREVIDEDMMFVRTIGWFTSIYPIHINDSSSDNLKDLIINIKELIRKIPNQGFDYGVLKYMENSYSESNTVNNNNSNICFNYLGQIANNSTDSKFDVDDFNSIYNDREREYELGFEVMVVDQQLLVKCIYSKQQFKQENIENLTKSYCDFLRTIVDFCTNIKSPSYTPSDFLYKKLSISQIDSLQEEYSIQDVYKLSPSQEGYLFHSLYGPNTLVYFEQQIFSIQGGFDIQLFKDSVDELISRYDIFRTVFLHEGLSEPVQLVKDSGDIDFEYINVREYTSENNKDQVIDEIAVKSKSRPFNLSSDCLMRFIIIQVSDTDYELIWNWHHILMDRWCLDVVFSELLTSYSSKLNNKPYSLPAPVQYKNFISWVENQNRDTAENYWKNYLNNYNIPTSIPRQKTTHDIIESENSTFVFNISKEKHNSLINICREYHVSMGMMIHSIWAILLAKYNDVSDVIFGSVVTGRPGDLDGVGSMIGLCINTIPLRFLFDPEETFISILEQAKKSILDGETYSYISLADIQSQSELRNTLFDHIFNFENAPESNKAGKSGKKHPLKSLNVRSFEKTNYNLSITSTVRELITFQITYNPNIYESFIIQRLKNDISNIIDGVISNPKTRIKDVNIISSEEKFQVLNEFNNLKRNPIKSTSFVEVFEDKVKIHHHNTAVVFGDQHLTYFELNHRAEQLAKNIYGLGCKKGSLVPIIFERSLELVISILAILKTGAAYVPIDKDWPTGRINEILKDVGAKNIMTNLLNVKEKFPEYNVLDVGKEINIIKKALPKIQHLDEDPFFVIYSSGSTGKPKGAININKGILNRFLYMNKRYKPQPEDVILLTSNHVFDASVWQLLWPLTNGLKTVIPKQKLLYDLDNIVELVQKEKISITDFVPSVFNLLVETIAVNPEYANKLGSLRQLLIGGEAMNPYHINKFKGDLRKVSITNTYGPVETSIGTVFYELPDEPVDNIPIGNPIDNVVALVLNKDKQLSPIGIMGELHLGGVCVGHGYLNNQERTNEVFGPINIPECDGQTYYQTGDMARFMPNGEIEFLGRLDSQLKIRGIRIELSEIENRILKHNKIKEVIVLDKTENNRTFLNAFYTADTEISSNEIREFLLKTLLEQMIPQKFFCVEKIPLTPNGKVDKHKLNLLLKKNKEELAIEIPNTELEKEICKIWIKVLNVDNIGVNDNFFDLGGNSLDLVRLDGYLKAEFNFKDSLMKLIQYPTIKSFSNYIESIQEGNGDENNDIKQNDLEKDVLKERRKNRQRNMKRQRKPE